MLTMGYGSEGESRRLRRCVFRPSGCIWCIPPSRLRLAYRDGHRGRGGAATHGSRLASGGSVGGQVAVPQRPRRGRRLSAGTTAFGVRALTDLAFYDPARVIGPNRRKSANAFI